MTPAVQKYIKDLVKIGVIKPPILDVGSYNVNGSVRDLVPQNGFIGIDMRAGPGVDFVIDITDPPTKPLFARNFTTVTCVETLEHVKNLFMAICEMYHFMIPGGYLVLAIPGIGFPLHNYPDDYWRVTESGMKYLLAAFIDVVVTKDGDHVYGYGKKM